MAPLAFELFLLDVRNFLQGHLAVLGNQQLAVFLVLFRLLDSPVSGADLAFQSAFFLFQLFQGLQHMAQGFVLFVIRLQRSPAFGANVLQRIRHAIPKCGKIVLTAQ